ncbi:unnamed protein product [Brassica napus]|uniref:(rape) hypothetical protein n=1 Tax=Brassica napus TaxID=3708 RepID=A0A816QUQ5_BRANA|nr:unnamed protein product [Brassica napus]
MSMLILLRIHSETLVHICYYLSLVICELVPCGMPLASLLVLAASFWRQLEKNWNMGSCE